MALPPLRHIFAAAENLSTGWDFQVHALSKYPCLQPVSCSTEAIQPLPQSQQTFFFQIKLKSSAVTGKWSRYFQLFVPFLLLTQTVTLDPAPCKMQCVRMLYLYEYTEREVPWHSVGKAPLGQRGDTFAAGLCQQPSHPIPSHPIPRMNSGLLMDE